MFLKPVYILLDGFTEPAATNTINGIWLRKIMLNMTISFLINRKGNHLANVVRNYVPINNVTPRAGLSTCRGRHIIVLGT